MTTNPKRGENDRNQDRNNGALDIFRFVDSQDIREHLRSIDYQFSTPEAAYLIWRSRNATLKERFDAWKWVIDAMPNCSMDERLNMPPIEDFHAFLREYMGLQKRLLEDFRQSEGCIYQFELKLARPSVDHYRSSPYTSLAKCENALRRELSDNDMEHVGIRFVKARLDPAKEPSREDWIDINRQGEVIEMSSAPESDRDAEVDLAFEGMWFSFPTPFHAGDIVCSVRFPKNPVVLTDLCTWDEATLLKELPVCERSERLLAMRDKRLERLRTRGDISDMSAYGYTISDTNLCAWPLVWNDDFAVANYLDLEMYRGQLTGMERAMKPLSVFVKEGNLEFLLNSFWAIALHEASNDQLARIRSCYLPDLIERAGLSADDASSKD